MTPKTLHLIYTYHTLSQIAEETGQDPAKLMSDWLEWRDGRDW